MTVRTCWIPRHLLEGSDIFGADHRLNVCRKAATGTSNETTRELVRLPGAIEELSRKLGFEVTQEPGFIGRQLPQVVRVGRPGEILINGARLWRSTTVTLGAQSADEIVVLPNMKGIIAKFDCIKPVKDPQFRVWTSEGATDTDWVEVEPAEFAKQQEIWDRSAPCNQLKAPRRGSGEDVNPSNGSSADGGRQAGGN